MDFHRILLLLASIQSITAKQVSWFIPIVSTNVPVLEINKPVDDLSSLESPEEYAPHATLATLFPLNLLRDSDYDKENYFGMKTIKHLEPLDKVQLEDHNDVENPHWYQHATIIFLHPIDEFGVSYKHFNDMLLRYRYHFIKMIYPSAPRRRYSPANGEIRYAWFDQWDETPYTPEKLNTFRSSMDQLSKLINEQIKNVSAERIIIGGMGMGGELAMHLAFRRFPFIRGVFALSSHLKNNSIVYRDLTKMRLIKYPYLFAGFSKDCKHSKLEWAKNTFDNLKKLGVNGEFHNLPLLNYPQPPEDLKSPMQLKLFRWFRKIMPDIQKQDTL